ncbi:MAG TPA: hypothetical protein VKF15_02150 [Nitrososphaerales archaeon]|nr:hypothetical protein [Nitrososphaerales archaeon]
MKVSWGVGEIVAVLLSLIYYLFLLPDAKYVVSLFLLLSGLWTVAAGLLFVDKKGRTFYSAWGVVVAVLSAFAFLPLNYTLGLVLVAVVVLILLTAFNYRSGRMFTAATQASPQTAGQTPAAT